MDSTQLFRSSILFLPHQRYTVERHIACPRVTEYPKQCIHGGAARYCPAVRSVFILFQRPLSIYNTKSPKCQYLGLIFLLFDKNVTVTIQQPFLVFWLVLDHLLIHSLLMDHQDLQFHLIQRTQYILSYLVLDQCDLVLHRTAADG